MILTRAVSTAPAILLLWLATAMAPAAAQSAAPPPDDSQRVRAPLERSLARSGGAILGPGERELELGFQYERTARVESVNKRAIGTLGFRAGLPWAAQLEVLVPYGRDKVDSAALTGPGDLRVGVAKEFGPEEARLGWIAGLAYERSPRSVGLAAFRPGAASVAAVGTGHDSVHATLTAVRSAEVVDLVATLGYSFSRDRTLDGVRIQPADVADLSVSAHFDVGEALSLRGGLSGSRSVSDLRLNGVPLPDTRARIAMLEAGATLSLSRNLLLDVSLGLGLTRDSPDFTIGISFPIYF